MGTRRLLLRGSLLLLVSCGLVTGVPVAASAEELPANAAQTASAPVEEFLFTVQAASGSTERLRGTPGVERFTLTLVDVGPVTRYSDRPFRDASLVSPRALASDWQSWFAGDPPNAVLTFARAGRAPGSMVVALTRPRYTAADRTLTFTAIREKRVDDPAEAGAGRERVTTPANFTSASLFIDGCSACGQIPVASQS